MVKKCWHRKFSHLTAKNLNTKMISTTSLFFKRNWPYQTQGVGGGLCQHFVHSTEIPTQKMFHLCASQAFARQTWKSRGGAPGAIDIVQEPFGKTIQGQNRLLGGEGLESHGHPIDWCPKYHHHGRFNGSLQIFIPQRSGASLKGLCVLYSSMFDVHSCSDTWLCHSHFSFRTLCRASKQLDL